MPPKNHPNENSLKSGKNAVIGHDHDHDYHRQTTKSCANFISVKLNGYWDVHGS